jgi:hypothetical protein
VQFVNRLNPLRSLDRARSRLAARPATNIVEVLVLLFLCTRSRGPICRASVPLQLVELLCLSNPAQAL